MALTLIQPPKQNTATSSGRLSLINNRGQVQQVKPTSTTSGYTTIGGKSYPTASIINTQPQQPNFFQGIVNNAVKSWQQAPIVGGLAKDIMNTKKDEGIGASIGKAMQKVPSPNLGTKGKDIFKATETETKIVDFLSNMPSAIVNSWGKSLETLSTPEGKKQLKEGAKNLPNTVKEVKNALTNKEWGKAFQIALDNPAVSVALDVSDFIPVTWLTKAGLKGVISPFRKVGQQIVKEGIEEAGFKTVKEVFEPVKVPEAPKAEIPKAKPLQPLAEEARGIKGYKNVDEYIKAMGGVDETTPNTWWHGSYSGDLRGGATGLHLGTKKAAQQALEARIGIPADGKGWNGNRSYGETLLAGKKTLQKLDPKGYNQTGFNAYNLPEEDFYIKDLPAKLKELVYHDGTPMPLTAKPSIKPFKLTGNMTNTGRPYDDFKANGYMSASIKRGNPKSGFYYTNVGEDAGSVSAVVPNGNFVQPLRSKEELIELYNKSKLSSPLEGAKVAPKVEPIGEGVTKASKLGLRVEQTAIEKKLTDELTDLPEYKQLNMKDQAKKASDLLNTDPDKAMRIALGEELPPEGLLKESVFKALEGSITTPEMAAKLANSPLVSEATALGQKIKALDVKVSDSPVESIRQVIDARAKALEKRLGRKPDIEKTTKDIKSKVKVPDKYDWGKFLEEIKC